MIQWKMDKDYKKATEKEIQMSYIFESMLNLTR